jgi:hypothetical protein
MGAVVDADTRTEMKVCMSRVRTLVGRMGPTGLAGNGVGVTDRLRWCSGDVMGRIFANGEAGAILMKRC